MEKVIRISLLDTKVTSIGVGEGVVRFRTVDGDEVEIPTDTLMRGLEVYKASRPPNQPLQSDGADVHFCVECHQKHDMKGDCDKR